MIAWGHDESRHLWWRVALRYFDDITGRVAIVRRNVEADCVASAREKALATIPDGIGDVLVIERAL